MGVRAGSGGKHDGMATGWRLAKHREQRRADSGGSKSEFWEGGDSNFQLSVFLREWVWLSAVHLSGDELDVELRELVHDVLCGGDESNLSESGQWEWVDRAGDPWYLNHVAEQPMHGECGAIVEFRIRECADVERGTDL